jgi:two-component system nitrate/nitrite response regulator NarL
VSPAEPITVVVADDHPVYRDGIVGAISRAPGLDLVAECSDGDAALETIVAHDCAVAVVDWVMPGIATPRLIEALAERGARTRVLVLSAFADPEGVAEALQAGAAGYISKEASRDAICQAIRRVSTGAVVLDESAQSAIADHLQTQRARERALLSDREREVLGLLADGASTQSIADRLVLSQATVKTHLRNLYDKLGVGDRAAAVAEAMRRGLLS